MRFGESCGRSDDVAEMMLQRLCYREYAAGVMLQRLWCRDYAAGGGRHAAGLSKPLRFGASCGRSDVAAEVMLQRLSCREYAAGVTLRGYGAGVRCRG